MSEQATTLGEQIRMALARGYCYPENSHKEMDSALVNAMAEEVVKIITHKIPAQKSCEGCEHYFNIEENPFIICEFSCKYYSYYKSKEK